MTILCGKLLTEEINNLTIDKINKMQDGVSVRSIQHYMITQLDEFKDATMLLIGDLVKSLNLGYNLNAEQIKQIPVLLNKEEFFSLTIQDIALFCNRVKIGYYGTLNRFDIPSFFDLLRKYNNEKLDIIIEENKQLKGDLTILEGERTNETIEKEIKKYKEANKWYNCK